MYLKVFILQNYWFCVVILFLVPYFYSAFLLYLFLMILRSVFGTRPEWNHSCLALCHLGGVSEGCHHRTDRLVDAHGQPLYHRGCPVCCPHPWTLLSWQVWHLGKYDQRWLLYIRTYLLVSYCRLGSKIIEKILDSKSTDWYFSPNSPSLAVCLWMRNITTALYVAVYNAFPCIMCSHV